MKIMSKTKSSSKNGKSGQYKSSSKQKQKIENYQKYEKNLNN